MYIPTTKHAMNELTSKVIYPSKTCLAFELFELMNLNMSDASSTQSSRKRTGIFRSVVTSTLHACAISMCVCVLLDHTHVHSMVAKQKA